MFVKKKSIQKTTSEDIQKQLEAYVCQARTYREVPNKERRTRSFLIKSSLASLIPLVAVGTIQAQGCEGAVNGGNTITLPFVLGSTNIQTYAIDIEGDNLTFTNLYSTGDYGTIIRRFGIKAANFQFIGNTASYLVSQFSGVVTRSNTKFFNNSSYNILCYQYRSTTNTPTTSRGSFCGTGTSFFGIKKTNVSPERPGWIQIEIIEITSAHAKFKILERGVEHPTNPNTNLAQTGDCSNAAQGIGAAVLPIEMIYFRAQVESKSIVLDWATATEINNAGFEIQRSIDGRHFAKIGWLAGHGNTQTEKTYRFIDDQVQPNTTYYYRLQQMDNDGSTSFSPIRTALVADGNAVHIGEFYPNPITKGQSSIQIDITIPKSTNINLQIYDTRGVLVTEVQKEYTLGQHQLIIPTQGMLSGQYFVKLLLNNKIIYRKLLVQ